MRSVACPFVEQRDGTFLEGAPEEVVKVRVAPTFAALQAEKNAHAALVSDSDMEDVVDLTQSDNGEKSALVTHKEGYSSDDSNLPASPLKGAWVRARSVRGADMPNVTCQCRAPGAVDGESSGAWLLTWRLQRAPCERARRLRAARACRGCVAGRAWQRGTGALTPACVRRRERSREG